MHGILFLTSSCKAYMARSTPASHPACISAAWEMVDPSFNAGIAKQIDLSDHCLHL